ncbi:alpha/beta hydrolase [Massilia sp. TSP1-1-2]|uniref:alpha/beta hydrolase n=1 Tax=unclassified Massilia TaxID=2609279 RepID=UPI003CE6758E
MPTQAHLYARPGPVTALAPTGMQTLPVGGKRDSYLYVPSRYHPLYPMPLVVLLHGAGGHAQDGLDILRSQADQAGMMLVAPASDAGTWDIIAARTYGSDIGPMTARGEPKIYISHGTEDEVLPVNPCARSIVKQLERLEFDVTYEEFDGGHTIPAEVAQSAVAWFTAPDKP